MKKSLFSTKIMVATGLGTALFIVLFSFVRIPTPIPNTDLQIAYGIAGFFGAIFGPICGFLLAFLGHALSDIIKYGSAYWSWVIASGVYALIAGLAYWAIKDFTNLTKKDVVTFSVIQVVAHAVAWIVVAPTLDILIYSEATGLAFSQGFLAFGTNSISSVLVGALLLVAYSKTQVKKGSLSKD